jgi:ABC-type antimicrobial peptide transport system permease subunit
MGRLKPGWTLEAGDPASFAMAAAALGGVGLIAAWIPAREASRVSLATALKE